MNMLRKVWLLLKHRHEVRMAISSVLRLAEGDANAAALGGLTDEEMRAACVWAAEGGGKTVVEVGNRGIPVPTRRARHRRRQLQLESAWPARRRA